MPYTEQVNRQRIMTKPATAEDFSYWQFRAERMSDAELYWSARNCHKTAAAMRGWNPVAEGRYDDEGFTYGDELRRRANR